MFSNDACRAVTRAAGPCDAAISLSLLVRRARGRAVVRFREPDCARYRIVADLVRVELSHGGYRRNYDHDAERNSK